MSLYSVLVGFCYCSKYLRELLKTKDFTVLEIHNPKSGILINVEHGEGGIQRKAHGASLQQGEMGGVSTVWLFLENHHNLAVGVDPNQLIQFSHVPEALLSGIVLTVCDFRVSACADLEMRFCPTIALHLDLMNILYWAVCS